VTVDGDTHHITKTARVGKIRADGQFDTIWESDGAIKPDPFLKTYDWAKSISTGS
jgi:urea transport system substrate-binding protein